jgi:hypothetical protein
MIRKYSIELFKMIFNLKKKFQNHRALIIGNEFLQGYLKKNELDTFKNEGHSTICIK